MGVCISLCPRTRQPNLEPHIAGLEISDKTDSSSDSSLKAKGSGRRDSTPLLDGPTLLSFRDLSPDSSSDSVDLEKDQLGALLKAAASSPDASTPPAAAPTQRTFKDVRPDLSIQDLPSSDSEGQS
jgi:hypothetical protein